MTDVDGQHATTVAVSPVASMMTVTGPLEPSSGSVPIAVIAMTASLRMARWGSRMTMRSLSCLIATDRAVIALGSCKARTHEGFWTRRVLTVASPARRAAG